MNKVEVAGAAALAYATATGGLGPASKQLVPVLVGAGVGDTGGLKAGRGDGGAHKLMLTPGSLGS